MRFNFSLMHRFFYIVKTSTICLAAILLAVLLIPDRLTTAFAAETAASDRTLSQNECLKKLNDNDLVIASIAFKDGINSSAQLKELLERKPWGTGTPATADEIKSQLDTQSPFLIITLTKKQALTLDKHRDIIRWVLVQSTDTPCE